MGRTITNKQFVTYARAAGYRPTKPNVVGSSPAGRAFLDSQPVGYGGKNTLWGAAMSQARTVASPVDWITFPAWLTFEQACHLSGWDRASMREIIAEGGVDLNDAGQIDKDDLLLFQETVAEMLHWDN